MPAVADIIAKELASPGDRSLQERLLEAMLLMERSRGVDEVWRDVVPQIGDPDVGVDAIVHLARALPTFAESHRQHPDVGSAIWALGAFGQMTMRSYLWLSRETTAGMVRTHESRPGVLWK